MSGSYGVGLEKAREVTSAEGAHDADQAQCGKGGWGLKGGLDGVRSGEYRAPDSGTGGQVPLNDF